MMMTEAMPSLEEKERKKVELMVEEMVAVGTATTHGKISNSINNEQEEQRHPWREEEKS